MSGQDVISANWAAGKQTFIIPLTFADIHVASDIITRIGYGGDIWEVRVDLLSPAAESLGDENLPSLDYVGEQLRALQSMSQLPILFTIRTKSQGGKFPDNAAAHALNLMSLAIDLEIAYIDVEIEWPQDMIQKLATLKGSTTQVVASYHSWTGKIAWTSQELKERFEKANGFGDIIKLSILSAEIEDTYELGLFVRQYRKDHSKPLLAVGMGGDGQLSRITSPISLVTHPLIPFPSAPGQLSLAEVHQARHLMGQLPKQQVLVSGPERESNRAVAALQGAFDELGYPYKATVCRGAGECASIDVTGLENGEDIARAVGAEFTKWTGRTPPDLVIESLLV